MASAINSDNGVVSGSAGLKSSADSSGVLDLQTNGTTAISISASQVVTYTNQPTYTGGTANGVMYLNGSKAVTTGTALVFDGTNLGVGTASPSAKLTVVGTIKTAAPLQSNFYLSNAAQTSGFLVGRSLGSNDAQNFFIYDIAAVDTRLFINESGNLGVGTTTPFNPGSTAQRSFELSGTSYATIFTSASSATVRGQFGVDAVGGTVGVGARTNHPFTFTTNDTERARFDSSGNFLINATTSRGLLTIGTPTSGPTGSPASINLGGSYSNTAGQYLKLALYADTNVYIGLGVSDAQLDYVVKDNAAGTISHNWYTTPTGISTPTKRMQLNASGALTIPNQPMFSAVHTATESLDANATLVQWAVYVLTNCSYSSGVFTASVAGRYLVCASLLHAISTAGGIYLRKNGVTLYRIFYCDDSTGYEMGSGEIIINLSVGDTVTLNQESTGSTWYGDGSGLGAWTINLLG